MAQVKIEDIARLVCTQPVSKDTASKSMPNLVRDGFAQEDEEGNYITTTKGDDLWIQLSAKTVEITEVPVFSFQIE